MHGRGAIWRCNLAHGSESTPVRVKKIAQSRFSGSSAVSSAATVFSKLGGPGLAAMASDRVARPVCGVVSKRPGRNRIPDQVKRGRPRGPVHWISSGFIGILSVPRVFTPAAKCPEPQTGQ